MTCDDVQEPDPSWLRLTLRAGTGTRLSAAGKRSELLAWLGINEGPPRGNTKTASLGIPAIEVSPGELGGDDDQTDEEGDEVGAEQQPVGTPKSTRGDYNNNNCRNRFPVVCLM